MSYKRAYPPYLSLLILFSFISCVSTNDVDPLFVSLSSDETGVHFENNLIFREEFNIYTYRNFYDGGGVAVGDLSGNGLPDLFFISNMEDNRLYFNMGGYKFQDVTKTAGVNGAGKWSTGVSFVDINGNGLLDIYVTNSGDLDDRRNELFVNNGDGTFTESATEYGLDDPGYSIHATFFDYNGDGLVDLYLVNNDNEPITNFDISENLRKSKDFLGGDRLYRNDGGSFTDVTEEAGIYSSIIGFGLSATVSDINRNGLTDIFVANDFFERDYLYINQGDGTYKEIIDDNVIRSMSAASMGSDIADLNNNGWPDIYVLDMLPEDEDRVKVVTTFESPERYSDKVDWGYGHQFTRNVLHINEGGDHFVEISRKSTVQATDWSWAVLLADFDLNGYNDIYVTNGLVHDITDLDYLEIIASPDRMRSIVGEDVEGFENFIDIIPSNPLRNYLFHNEGELNFTDRTVEWGLDEPGFSSGAAWADLNGDGALDLVVNNTNGPARIYKNRSAELYPDRTWLRVMLDGESPNTQGIGAQLQVWSGDRQWYREHFLQRGFQSSVEPGLHVGLGETQRIDSLVVRWPDGRTSRMTDLDVPATITLSQADADDKPAPQPGPATFPGDFSKQDLTALSECETCKRPGSTEKQNLQASDRTWQSSEPKPSNNTDADRNPRSAGTLSGQLLHSIELPPLTNWTHTRYDYVDFNRENLLMRMRSTEGPAMCTGDITGNGLDDLYIGGARNQPGTLWVQNVIGEFRVHKPELFAIDSGSEDIDCTFFDATGNGVDDLYVVSGGNSYSTSSSLLVDRLYLNNGEGGLRKSEQMLPTMRRFDSGSVVAANDFTGDGNQDLFVGTRLRSFGVGLPVNGYLLAGDGQGNFSDVTEQWAPMLTGAGMITDALWADLTGNGQKELVIAGEWMPIRVFTKNGDAFEEITDDLGLSGTRGWWNSLAVGDINGNGRLDLIGGNHGENSMFRAREGYPVKMWVGDFARNGMVEQILATEKDGEYYPVALRHDLIEQIPALREKYPDYTSYAGQTVDQIFSSEQLSQANELNAHMLQSMIFWDRGDGVMEGEPLPPRAQLSPMYGIAAKDLTGNGRAEIILGGNLYGVKPQSGPYDASRGVVIGYENGALGSYNPHQAGLNVNGEIRGVKTLKRADGSRQMIIARYNDSPVLLRQTREP